LQTQTRQSLNSTGPTRTRTPTPTRTSSPTSTRAEVGAARAEVGLPRRARSVQLADFCPTFVRRALLLARMSVGDARVYRCTCTVHDKLSCTHLQNYTIGASLKSVLMSVSVPWNLSSSGLNKYRILVMRLASRQWDRRHTVNGTDK